MKRIFHHVKFEVITSCEAILQRSEKQGGTSIYICFLNLYFEVQRPSSIVHQVRGSNCVHRHKIHR